MTKAAVSCVARSTLAEEATSKPGKFGPKPATQEVKRKGLAAHKRTCYLPIEASCRDETRSARSGIETEAKTGPACSRSNSIR